MAIFAVYRYELKRVEATKNLFSGLTDEELGLLHTDSSKEELFESYFEPKSVFNLEVLKRKADKNNDAEWEAYKTEVLQRDEHIVVMTVENNKHKDTTVDKKKKENPHHPFCNVMIDMREGMNLIAIERSSAFDNKPERLAKVLLSGLNKMLGQDHYEMKLYLLQKDREEFWETVNSIRSMDGNKVQQIRLDYNKQKGATKAAGGGQDVLAMMALLAMKADHGLVMFEAKGGREIDLQSMHEDLVNIAKICLEQEQYDLTVKFDKFGLFRYGHDVVAQYGVDDDVIDGFVNGVKELALEMEEQPLTLKRWFKEMKEVFKDFSENESTPVDRRRNKRSRK